MKNKNGKAGKTEREGIGGKAKLQQKSGKENQGEQEGKDGVGELFESPGLPAAGEGDESKRRLIGGRGVTTMKTTEAEQRQWTTAEVSRTGSGVTNPCETTEGMWWLSMEEISDMRDCWIIGY